MKTYTLHVKWFSGSKKCSEVKGKKEAIKQACSLHTLDPGWG